MTTVKGNGLSPAQVQKLEDVYNSYMFEVNGIKSVKDAPSVETNPFLYKLSNRLQMTRKVKNAINGITSVDIIDRETGEVTSGVNENRVFVKTERVDNDKFIKVFQHRLKEMFNLGHPAIKVIGYFMQEMQKPKYIKSDHIYFNLNDCMDFCGYTTHPMVYRGLTELIREGFVAKSDQVGYYFVDTDLGFNGNRIIIMDEYIKKDNGFDGQAELE